MSKLLTKLTSKLFGPDEKHQNAPMAMCSSTVVDTDPNFKGIRCATKLPEVPGADFVLLKAGDTVTKAHVCQIKKQLVLAEEMHKIDCDQFEFFHTNSKYLQIRNDVLSIFAPDPIVDEQLALFKREKILRLKMKQGSASCIKCKYFSKFGKQDSSSAELTTEYFRLKAEYQDLISDNSDKLRVIAFLSVVFSCKNNMIDDSIPDRNQDE